MTEIEGAGKKVNIDNDGFLGNFDAWNAENQFGDTNPFRFGGEKSEY